MNTELNLNDLQQLESQLAVLNSRISSLELELKIASASGKQEQSERLKGDLTGLLAVRSEIQSKVDEIHAEVEQREQADIAAQENIIQKHEDLKAQYLKKYWRSCGWGAALIVLAFVLFAIPFIAVPIGAVGVYKVIVGLSQWPKAQAEEMLIPFLRAGVSEEDAIQQIAQIKRDVAATLEKEQRDRERLAEEIVKKMKNG
jgi:hypothetical protein